MPYTAWCPAGYWISELKNVLRFSPVYQCLSFFHLNTALNWRVLKNTGEHLWCHNLIYCLQTDHLNNVHSYAWRFIDVTLAWGRPNQMSSLGHFWETPLTVAIYGNLPVISASLCNKLWAVSLAFCLLKQRECNHFNPCIQILEGRVFGKKRFVVVQVCVVFVVLFF